MARKSSLVLLAALAAAAHLAILSVASFVFGSPLPSGRLVSPMPRSAASFNTGKLNLGLEGTLHATPSMPQPLLEVNVATSAAILDCLEEGCSVDALIALDEKIARDEQKIKDVLDELHNLQKTEYTDNAVEQIAWLENFMGRAGSLRGQLHAVKTVKVDGNFVQQLMRAASVAFGGGRPTDYPKVGASPYTS
ncbi:unnamed protein product [Polarella glacialis]|uniref:Uncharacterized protein n=1 Tax=Polarella glacialis TaxID=89957 RepID=A0A813LUC7_POLGL|nr:unnamed protein product [Polarella glacialis]CAE8739007.1 unnamed protein product [Polarella glacialis]